MSWNAILGVACIVALFLPVAVIIYNRYYLHRSLAALLIYYTITALYVMMAEDIIRVSTSFRINFGILNNYLDVPLMLVSLLFFCPGRQKQRIIHILILVFIAYEIVITSLQGYSAKAIVYILGPGMVIILCYSFYLFVKQVKFTIMHGKNLGRTIMLASILFVYACYAIIYYFYYIDKTPHIGDTHIIYFISSFISSVFMAIGLHLMRKRMKELHSLRLTRKELAIFFGLNAR